MNVTDLNLGLSVALGEDLFQTCLEDTDIVVDESLLLRWIVLTHYTHQCQVPVRVSVIKSDFT